MYLTIYGAQLNLELSSMIMQGFPFSSLLEMWLKGWKVKVCMIWRTL